MFDTPDGFRRERAGLVVGGLDLELVLLCWLNPEPFEEFDSVGAWYGLPIPNSTARLTLAGTGGASSIRVSVLVIDLIRLPFRGGGGLDDS